jgi:hypothetical protein
MFWHEFFMWGSAALTYFCVTTLAVFSGIWMWNGGTTTKQVKWKQDEGSNVIRLIRKSNDNQDGAA